MVFRRRRGARRCSESESGRARWPRSCSERWKHLDGVAGFQPPCVVAPDFAVDFDAPRLDELAHLRPGLAGQPEAQAGGERFAGVVGGDGEGLGVCHAPLRRWCFSISLRCVPPDADRRLPTLAIILAALLLARHAAALSPRCFRLLGTTLLLWLGSALRFLARCSFGSSANVFLILRSGPTATQVVDHGLSRGEGPGFRSATAH